MAFYLVRGAPDNSGVPEFMTVGNSFNRYLPGLQASFAEDLNRVKPVLCAVGLEGILVTSDLYDKLPKPGNSHKLKMGKPPAQVSALLQLFAKRIESEIDPAYPGYIAKAKEAILAMVPSARFAASIEEAATVLGVKPFPHESVSTSPQPPLSPQTA